jgi:O-antigen/teichoic acid export membrane protein
MIKIWKWWSIIIEKKGRGNMQNVMFLLLLNCTTILCQFFVFAAINRQLGKEQFGVWSLVTAVIAISQISNFGFSTGLLRYIPELFLSKNISKIKELFGTVLTLNFCISLPMLMLLYFPSVWYARQLLSNELFIKFNSLIVWCVAGLFFSNLFAVYAAMLDGMQKYYQRCIMQIFGWILFFVLSILLMPSFGLKGVAIAYFIQNAALLVAAVMFVLIKQTLPGGITFQFSKEAFTKVTKFGMKAQAVSILVIFFDPLVKFFITKYLGLSATGNYELVNKVSVQARNLLVNANQVFIPKLILQRSVQGENDYFETISKRNLFYSSAVAMLVLVVSPLAIYFFSGNYSSMLMAALVVVNFGWFCNMATSLHYYACTAFDLLNYIIVYHFILALVVALLYYAIGDTAKNSMLYYCVPSFALLVGSIFNSYALKTTIQKPFSWMDSRLFFFMLFATVVFLFVAPQTILTAYLLIGVILLLFFAVSWRNLFQLEVL